jgi:hypothetical protein
LVEAVVMSVPCWLTDVWTFVPWYGGRASFT